MKKSIIYLGIALLTFTNVISALAQQSFIIGESLTQTKSSNASLDRNTQDNHSTERRNTNEERDQANSSLEIMAVSSYQKTMEEIIAENNQIIESTISDEQYVEDNQIDIRIDASPYSSEKTIEETILEDSQIIENQVFNTTQPITSVKSKKS